MRRKQIKLVPITKEWDIDNCFYYLEVIKRRGSMCYDIDRTLTGCFSYFDAKERGKAIIKNGVVAAVQEINILQFDSTGAKTSIPDLRRTRVSENLFTKSKGDRNEN